MPGGIHPPLTVIESWPKPSAHPDTHGWHAVILIGLLWAFMTIVLAMRLWARLRLQHNAGLDDAFVVAAYIPTTGLALATCLASKMYGFDRHVWDIPQPELIQTRKITFAIECLYVASTSLTRISILFFYRRIATGSISRAFLWAVRACLAFVVAYLITFEVTLFAGCRPFSAFWKEADLLWVLTNKGNYHCISEAGNLYAASFVSLVQDLIVCAMPTTLFWTLQLPRRQKIALAAIFGIGGFLCVVGVLRIYYIHYIIYETYDVTWAAQNVWMWTGIEAELAIACASAPTLKVFMKEYFDTTCFSTFGSASRNSRLYGYFGRSKRSDQNTGTTMSGGDLESGVDSANSTVKDNGQVIRLGDMTDVHGKDAQAESWVRETARPSTPVQEYPHLKESSSNVIMSNDAGYSIGDKSLVDPEQSSGGPSRGDSTHPEAPPIPERRRPSLRSPSLCNNASSRTRGHHRVSSSQDGIMIARDVQFNAEELRPSSEDKAVDTPDGPSDALSGRTGSSRSARRCDQSKAANNAGSIFLL